MGNLLGTISGKGAEQSVVQYSYDKANRVTKMTTGLTEYSTNPAGGAVTSYQYNTDGSLAKITDPMGNIESYTYHDNGNVKEKFQRNGEEVYYAYNIFGIYMAFGSGGAQNRNVYNGLGQVIRTEGQNQNGETVEESYTYDLLGRVSSKTSPDGTVQNYTYDNNSNILSYNMVKDNETKNSISYEYNALNQLTSLTNNGTISYTYNYDGTLASKTYPDNKTITYNAYNVNKALTSMTDYLGNTTTYTYNARGAVTAIGEKYSGTSTINTTRYTYNTDGSLQKVTYPLSSYMTSIYTYDYAGRVSNLTNKLTSSSTYSTHVYTYDNSGNVTQKVDTISGTSKTTSYIYDSVNRLIKETIGTSWNRYYYDQYNNITSEVGWGDTYYTYDANNRLTYIDDQWCYKETADGSLLADWESDLTYDKNGNLLSYKTCSYNGVYEDGSQNTYTYDAWGRLTNFSDSLGETASYSYYSEGLRESKTIGSNTTKYYYDGDNIINETLNGNSYATNVVGVDGYISRKQNSTTGYLFKNAHGDVLAAYLSTSNKLADYSYTAWGEQQLVNETSNFTNNPLRYCGEYYDYESGMTYLRARYYDSNIKRFMSEDPHWNVDNMIYGDEQQAVEYRIVNNTKIYYDKYGNVIDKKEYNPDIFTLVKQSYSDDTVQIQRVPNAYSILQGNNLYVYGINNPILYSDTSGESVRGVGIEALAGFGFGISGQCFRVSDDYGNQGTIFVANFGIETGASISVEGFYFPNMNSIYDLRGSGFSMGASGAYGGSWIGTDSYRGVAVSKGMGSAEIHITVGYTVLFD